jgi:DNA-binding transcriptional regulator YhcF (GntR family)
MALTISVDAADPTPPYEQVRRQIAAAIAAGGLPVGTRLPTVRQLAGDLGVANGTVMRTYSELETAGLVTTGRRAGTVVAQPPTLAPDDRQARLATLANTFVSQARLLATDDHQILDAIDEALQAG